MEKNMKKNLFIMLIAIFSIFSFNEAKAQIVCPSGYVLRTVPPIIVNGCTITAEVCVKCNPMAPTFDVVVRRILGGCNPLDGKDYLDAIQQYVVSHYTQFCIGSYVPCESGDYKVIYYHRPICWYLNPDDNSDMLSCDGSICISVYKVCTNSNGTVTYSFLIPPYIEYGYNGCPYSYDDPRRTEPCFHIPNDCQP